MIRCNPLGSASCHADYPFSSRYFCRATCCAAESPRKFQFAPGKVEDGYTLVPPDCDYQEKLGYGFEPGATITAEKRVSETALHSGFCTSATPFFFSIDLPEGNYRVAVTLGDSLGESTTTVKAEQRRLMLEGVHTARGEFATRDFAVNTRTPQIAGGGAVKLKAPRETVDEAWSWDKRLTLEFNDSRVCLCALTIEKIDVPTVFILGDSTVCDQPKEPYASWGQMLTRFLKPGVAVANHAESGESLQSSTGAHRFEKVLSEMKAGDYLLIQYGHNDMKSKDPDAVQKYKVTLKKWVRETKQKGGIPVLITPMHRHRFEGDKIVNSLGAYPETVREAAKEENVALIDLNNMSKSFYEALGPKPSIMAFKHDSPDDPKFDGTHHSPYGAYELAKCVALGIKQAKLDLAVFVMDEAAAFDPARPDPAAEFKVPPSPGRTTQRPLGD